MDFIHLWHGRDISWTKYHEINRAIEAELNALPMSKRIGRQYQALAKTKYAKHIADAKARLQ
jgi:hypothetical protein